MFDSGFPSCACQYCREVGYPSVISIWTVSLIQQQLKGFASAHITGTLNNPPKNMDEHWDAVESVLISGASEIVAKSLRDVTRPG